MIWVGAGNEEIHVKLHVIEDQCHTNTNKRTTVSYKEMINEKREAIQ